MMIFLKKCIIKKKKHIKCGKKNLSQNFFEKIVLGNFIVGLFITLSFYPQFLLRKCKFWKNWH